MDETYSRDVCGNDFHGQVDGRVVALMNNGPAYQWVGYASTYSEQSRDFVDVELSDSEVTELVARLKLRTGGK